MIPVFIFSAAFILAAMAMVLLVFRDSRPRPDDWHTIIRRVDSPPPSERHNPRGYCDRKDSNVDRIE